MGREGGGTIRSVGGGGVVVRRIKDQDGGPFADETLWQEDIRRSRLLSDINHVVSGSCQ